MSILPKASVLNYSTDFAVAVKLIKLGARLQVLESVKSVSKPKKVQIYKELTGKSPSKGMLPSSADWFLLGQANAHASSYYALHRAMVLATGKDDVITLIKAYEAYLDLIEAKFNENGVLSEEPFFSINRAWTLLRFIKGKLLNTSECISCHGKFIVSADDIHHGYLCLFCNPPARISRSVFTTSEDIAEEGVEVENT